MMRRTRRSADRAILDDAIRSYREIVSKEDAIAATVMLRLSKCQDGIAAEAFAEIGTTHLLSRRLLLCCIEAETIRKTFGARIKRELEMRAFLPPLLDHIEALRAALPLIADRARDRITAGDPADNQEYYVATLGLKVFENIVLERLRIAYETLPRVGATQKHTLPNAPYLAATGWIAEGMISITGQPHLRHTMNLAAIAMAMSPLTEDQVRKAYRSRLGRDWRRAFPDTGPFRAEKRK